MCPREVILLSMMRQCLTMWQQGCSYLRRGGGREERRQFKIRLGLGQCLVMFILLSSGSRGEVRLRVRRVKGRQNS